MIRALLKICFSIFFLMGVSSRLQAADPALIAAAKKEGQLTWYTTQIVNQFARPAAIAFEKK